MFDIYFILGTALFLFIFAVVAIGRHIRQTVKLTPKPINSIRGTEGE